MNIIQNRKFPPLWVVLFSILLISFSVYIIFNHDYKIIFFKIINGVFITFYISVLSYIFSVLFGLTLALVRILKIKILSEFIVFYVELIRSLPVLVVLFYVAYIGTPFLINLYNFIIDPLVKLNILSYINIREVGYATRVLIALVLCYSVFISENFRAGIESVAKGQMEAGRSLGLSWFQTMVYIILPQVIKNMLPTLVNEFVAIIKDSSLVSVLGVKDITYLGKVYSASSFKFFETYNVVAFIYLLLIFLLSLFSKKIEKKLKR